MNRARCEQSCQDLLKKLPDGPQLQVPDIPLDPDVAEQRGRDVPVNLELLVQEIVLPPDAKPWFADVVKSTIHSSPVKTRVTRSSLEYTPDS